MAVTQVLANRQLKIGQYLKNFGLNSKIICGITNRQSPQTGPITNVYVIICNIYIFLNAEQQHLPNKPYQLGTDCEDRPKDGIIENIKLRAGDYIVFGSDGVFCFV